MSNSINLVIKPKSDDLPASPTKYLSYFSEVDSHIKMNGDFRCYPESMTDETYNALQAKGYMVIQFLDHFRVTKRPEFQTN